MSVETASPIFSDSTGYYFWSETWDEYFGPFPTQAQVELALRDYVGYLDDPSFISKDSKFSSVTEKYPFADWYDWRGCT